MCTSPDAAVLPELMKVHIHVYVCPSLTVTPGPEEQIKAPPLPPQPELSRLPVSVRENPEGAPTSCRLLIFLLAVNPKSTPVIRSLLEFGTELRVIVRVAEVLVMSKE